MSWKETDAVPALSSNLHQHSKLFLSLLCWCYFIFNSIDLFILWIELLLLSLQCWTVFVAPSRESCIYRSSSLGHNGREMWYWGSEREYNFPSEPTASFQSPSTTASLCFSLQLAESLPGSRLLTPVRESGRQSLFFLIYSLSDSPACEADHLLGPLLQPCSCTQGSMQILMANQDFSQYCKLS